MIDAVSIFRQQTCDEFCAAAEPASPRNRNGNCTSHKQLSKFSSKKVIKLLFAIPVNSSPPNLMIVLTTLLITSQKHSLTNDVNEKANKAFLLQHPV